MIEMPEDSVLLSYLGCFTYQKDSGQCEEINIVSSSLPYHPKRQDRVISYFLRRYLFARMSCLPAVNLDIYPPGYSWRPKSISLRADLFKAKESRLLTGPISSWLYCPM